MSAPVSHELVTHDGRYYIVEGNPDVGYTTLIVVMSDVVGTYKRKWQAKQAIYGPEAVA